MPEDILSLIQQHARPCTPHPSGTPSRLRSLGQIKAVLFDVYGTLFISGSGDIGLTAGGDRASAMARALQAEQFEVPHPETLPEIMDELIRQSHASSRRQGRAFPEVEIRSLWRRLLESAQPERPLSQALIERVAVRYESVVNPVWPMPGAQEILTHLQEQNFILGIISNAQFYTPPLFPALLGASLETLGFDPALCLWSYEEGEAKPSPSLFHRMQARLQKRSILPQEALYIGNDMRNDIATAAAAGFRSALFAADQRSLRWREEDRLGVTPDLVLTHWHQLRDCLEPST